jgi:hypothetical protein
MYRLSRLVGIVMSVMPLTACEFRQSECADSSDCPDSQECVRPEDAAPRCRPPAECGDCCFGARVNGECPGELPNPLPTEEDGCSDGLVCIGEVSTGVDGGPRDPICVSATNRTEGERCNVGSDECAPAHVCQFGQGTCRFSECTLDTDCSPNVCRRGAPECPGRCEPPAQLGDACFRDSIEDCVTCPQEFGPAVT